MPRIPSLQVLPEGVGAPRQNRRPAVAGGGEVQQVGAARDPGVQAPRGAFGEDIGAGLSDFGGALARVADRQISRQEVYDSSRLRTGFEDEARQKLLDISTQDDLSREDVAQAYGTWLAERQQQLLDEFGGRPDARAQLAADLDDKASGFSGQAGALAVMAGIKHVETSLDRDFGPLLAEVSSDPYRIDEFLGETARIVSRAGPALRPEQQATIKAAMDDQLAESAVEMLLSRGDVDGAEELIDVHGLSQVMTGQTQLAMRRKIGTQRTSQNALETELAQAERLLGRPLTQAEIAQKLGLASRAPQVNIGPQVGSIPPGYQVEYDQAGRPVRMAPIPGSPAAAEMQQAEQQAVGRRETEATKAGVMVRDADRALALIDQGAGGAEASVLARVPGNQHYQLNAALESIRANVGFEQLQQMRAASPTGGALGAISERENVLLQSALGNLDIAQDPAVLRENIATIRDLQLDAIYGSPTEHEAAIADGRMTEDQSARLVRARKSEGLSILSPAEGAEPAAGMPVVRSRADYDALPPGTRYQNEAGETGTKR